MQKILILCNKLRAKSGKLIAKIAEPDRGSRRFWDGQLFATWVERYPLGKLPAQHRVNDF